MTLSSFIRTAIFGCPLTTEERPSVDGERAWAEVQARFAEEKEAARKAHAAVRHIEAKQQDWVHSALGLKANRSVPTEGLSDAAADRVAL